MKLNWYNESISQGEHNNLMHNAYYGVQRISDSLRRANGIAIAQAAYEADFMSREEYVATLKELGQLENFDFKFKDMRNPPKE